jgi:acetoin utilization protein AcuB
MRINEMKIESFMVSNPITISETTPVYQAIELMKENRIRHLPVVNSKCQLSGWITLSDLKQGLIPSMLGELSLADMINRAPLTVAPDDDIEVAAKLIYKHKIGGMPVVKDSALVGIITESDILRAFIDMMGILTASSRLDVVIDDSPNALKKVLHIIHENEGDIISIGHTLLDNDNRLYYFRLRLCKTALIQEKLEQEGFEVRAALD